MIHEFGFSTEFIVTVGNLFSILYLLPPIVPAWTERFSLTLPDFPDHESRSRQSLRLAVLFSVV